MQTLPALLTPPELATVLGRLASETFVDGLETASGRAAAVKRNLQLPLGSAAEGELNGLLQAAFDRSEQFRTVAMPLHMTPMRFSRYEPGMTYGWHVDNALMASHGGRLLRSDLACTVFLADPASYTGGELMIQTAVGQLQVKLAAGDAVIYPANTVHQVAPVTAGVRLAAVTWIQSIVASEAQRQLILDLLGSIQTLRQRDPMAPELDRLAGTYNNLMRMWGQF